jgi:hypothetical protein
MKYTDEQVKTLHELFAQGTAEQNFSVLRIELLGLLPAIEGFAQLIQAILNQGDKVDVPEELEDWIEKIVENSTSAQTLVNAYFQANR